MPEPGCIWITGASSGIGQALARRLGRDGETVAISARNGDALEAMAEEGLGTGLALRPFPLDVTDEAAVARAVDDIESSLGPIRLAVLNAGTHRPVTSRRFDTAAFRALWEVNVMGVVHGFAALLPRMQARRRGHLAVVGSVAGYRGLPTAAAYGASKAALINLCESMRFDLARDGIDLSIINPGFVRTPLTDANPFRMPYLMSAEAAAEHIRTGLRARKYEIAFPWQFVMQLRLLGMLPHGLYFRLVGSRTGDTR